MRGPELLDSRTENGYSEKHTTMMASGILLTVCMLMLLPLLSAQEKTVDHWGTDFETTCFSEALDTMISFPVRLPPKVDGLDKYPLVVLIKAGLRVAPSAEYPFIEVKPPSGGIWGYRSMSAVNVRMVIAFMKQQYPVDEDRVYLVGFSAGASGAMQLAATDTDQFAAVLPLVAVGTDYPIGNFRNLPVAQHHGTVDWTSSICNARAQHQRLKAMGCPAQLIEYEGVGHSVPLPHEPIVEWMLKQKRNRSPKVITHECETADLGKAYWLRVEQFIDPHQRAKVNATFGEGTLKMDVENIGSFSIYSGFLPEPGVEHIEVGNQKIKTDGLPDSVTFCLEATTNTWYFCESQSNPRSKGRKRALYRAGAAANLYEGEPLLVVYGSANGNAHRSAQLLEVARRLAACGGPHAGSMTPHFRVVADRDLTPEQRESFNLILLGAPGENLITDRLLPEFPLDIEGKILRVKQRENLSLQGRVLSCLYPNPESQKRLVYVVAPFLEGDESWKKFAENPQRFLIGSDGFDRISQADLAVKNLDQQFCRQMQFDQNWQWQSVEGKNTKIAMRFGDRSELAQEYMKEMRKKSGADFALWWGPTDQGMWGSDFNFLPRYDPNDYRLADFRTQHREIQTLIGKVSGLELREIWNLWGLNEEMISEPAIDLSAIEDNRSYRLNIPMDFYIKLGQRKKALVDPQPGPQINIEELEEAIFQD